MKNIFDLTGKTAIITGGTRGIGRAIALGLAKAGFTVGFCYQSSHNEAESLLKLLSECNGGYAFPFDLNCTDRLGEFSKQVLEKMPEVSVLVNNAGVSSYSLFQDVTETEFHRVFSINFESAFFLTKEFVPGMIRRRHGRIINISSIWGQTGASCEVLYSSSKAAIIGFTKGLAKELAPCGIRVNAIAPGIIDTDMISSFSEQEISEMTKEIPCGRIGAPDDVANVALFLASDLASYITGEVINVSGGYVI